MKPFRTFLFGTAFIAIIFFVILVVIRLDLTAPGEMKTMPDESEYHFSADNEVNSNVIMFNKAWKSSPRELANPYALFLWDDYLIVQDYSSDRPLPVFKTNGTFSHYTGNWGKGPGEVSSAGHTVVGIRDGNILVYDRETSRILSFEVKSGNFVAEKNTALKTFPYLHGDKLVSRAAVPFAHFAYGVTLNRDLTTERDTVIYGQFDELEMLYAAKYNHLLKQGAVNVDDENNTYIAMNNSSLIIGFDSDGNVIFKNDKPTGMGTLPDLREIDLPALLRGGLISPPLNMFPKHYVSVAVNDRYVLGLYSGFQVKNRQDFLDADKANEGALINLFDKHTSDYITTLPLDTPLKGVVLYNNDLYAISVNPDIALIKYTL